MGWFEKKGLARNEISGSKWSIFFVKSKWQNLQMWENGILNKKEILYTTFGKEILLENGKRLQILLLC